MSKGASNQLRPWLGSHGAEGRGASQTSGADRSLEGAAAFQGVSCMAMLAVARSSTELSQRWSKGAFSQLNPE